jgi:EPS-associated MarR family transcriptional regulator
VQWARRARARNGAAALAGRDALECSTVEHTPPGEGVTEDPHYRILRELERDPHVSQRRLAEELGVSVGKINYLLKALIDRGLVKADNFRNSQNKRAYLYVLTPKGIAEKSRNTVRFLRRKTAEYEALRKEIERLRREARQR